MKTYYDERLDELSRRADERIDALLEQLRLERESVDKRFEAANRYKENYSETLHRLQTDSLKREEVDTRFAVIQEKLYTLTKFSIGPYTGLGGLIVSAAIGLWYIIGQKIDVTNLPVAVTLEQLRTSNETRDRTLADFRTEFSRSRDEYNTERSQTNRDISNQQQVTEASKIDRGQLNERLRITESAVAASAQADANSRTDRAQLNERVRLLENVQSGDTADRKANEATLKASLIEIETQFCQSGNMMNLMHAYDLRMFSMLYAKTDMGHLPTDNAFYPILCARDRK